MSTFRPLFLLLFAFGLCARADQFKIPLRVQDNGGAVDTAWFGVDPNATYCIDPALGEYQLPPPSPGIDVRFVGIQGRVNCLGTGTKIDLRHFTSPTQIDTYKVLFKPGDAGGYPVTISWPDLAPYYTNPVWLKDRYTGGLINIDMKTQNFITISDTLGLNSLIIVTGNAKSSGAAPFGISSAGRPKQFSARLLALVNPDGDSTMMWLEWGTTTGYGNTTPKIMVGVDYGEGSYSYDISGLSPGTTYHLRAWAQNSFGITSTGDNSFKTYLASDGPGKIVIPLEGVDAMGDSSTVYFGVWPGATYCMDADLGEFAMPPPPPNFELRLLESRPFSRCFDQGTFVDLRPYISPTQVDTYKVSIGPWYGIFPVTLSWPDLNSIYANPVWLRDVHGGSWINIDMKAQTSYVMPESLAMGLAIVTGNGGPFTGPPFVSSSAGTLSLDQTSAVLAGWASPNSVATTAWLEWGTSTAYGNTTPVESIGSGANSVQVHAAISGLTPRTTYHVRTVANNSLGTTYGADNSFMTKIDGTIGVRLITLQVSDHGGAHGTYWLGVHPDATVCVDASLGEFELPPSPPGFEVRLLNTACSRRTIAMNEDFRPLIGVTQVDTYRVQFKPGDAGYPMTVAWPNLAGWFNNSARLVDIYGGLAVNVDMMSTTSYDLTNDAISSLLIVTGTPGTAPAAPSVLTNKPTAVTGGSAEGNAVLNPNGFATSAWFEWGISTGYGNSTSPRSVAAGTSVTTLTQLISGLSPNGNYHYRIVASNANGTTPGPDQAFTTGSVLSVGDQPALPKEIALLQNYPNPFNPTSIIQFALPASSRVLLRIYNPLGQLVKTLLDQTESAGIKSVTFDAGSLPSGVYFYRLQAGSFVDVKKMILIR